MKRICSIFMAIVMLLALTGCSGSPKIYDVPDGIVLSSTEIVELFYDKHTLRKQSKPLPESMAFSLKEPTEYPVVFAFFPEYGRLVLVVEDPYPVPESEWFAVGFSVIDRRVVIGLDVPYRNPEELLVQDGWYGSSVDVCLSPGWGDRERLLGAFYLEDAPVVLPSDLEGPVYGLYYPGQENAVQLTENPLPLPSSERPSAGYYVVSGDTISAVFREVLLEYGVLPEE